MNMALRKKWWAFVGLLLVLLISAVYIFIPGELTISRVQLVKCNISGAFRSVSDEASWKKWWPGEGIDGYFCQVSGSAYPEVSVSLRPEDGGISSRNDQGIPGTISLLSVGVYDSTAILWNCRLNAGLDPVTRLLQYRRAIRIRNTMDTALSNLVPFLEKKENVYGMDVRNGMSKDSTLVVTQILTASYPSTADIYQSIHSIRDYVAGHGAKETDHPMLHVRRRKDGQYESMIAIPVDRELEANKAFVPERFMPWKILMGEVHGGVYTAERAMDQLEHYLGDYQKTAMAVSFQSLVTERDKETDTSRWITRVIVPIP
jgi:hypothetical protein